MRLVLAFVALSIGLIGCEPGTPEVTAITARTGYQITGASVASPNQPGWIMFKSAASEVIFGTADRSTGDSTIAMMTGGYFKGFKTDAGLFQIIFKQILAGQPDGRFVLKQKRRQRVTFHGARCLKYWFVWQDLASPVSGAVGPQYLKSTGYSCRHPQNQDYVYQIDVTNRSSSKAFTRATTRLANGFFAGVRFNTSGP